MSYLDRGFGDVLGLWADYCPLGGGDLSFPIYKGEIRLNLVAKAFWTRTS